MFSSLVIVCLGLSLVGAVPTGVEFVELNDANQATLKLELSKALKGVQEALTNEFKFESIKDAVKFVNQCEFVKDSMASASDADFDGMAAKIKKILAEPTLKAACEVNESDLSKLAILDEDLGGYAKRLSKLQLTKQVFEENPKVKILLNHLYEAIALDSSENLLKSAAEDVGIFFGQKKNPNGYFDFDIKYEKCCDITALKPICKIVRRTDRDTVTASGADFVDFNEILATKNEAKLSAYSEASGVQLDELKESCKKVQKFFRPILRVEEYKKAQLISDEMLKSQLKIDEDFEFYYQLYHMCQTAQK